eukprot:UN10772
MLSNLFLFVIMLFLSYVKVEQFEDLLEECEFAKDTYEPTWDKVFNTFHITAIAKLNIPAPDQAISRVPISEDSNMKSIKIQLDKLLQEADCEESDSQEMETNKPEIENSVEKMYPNIFLVSKARHHFKENLEEKFS